MWSHYVVSLTELCLQFVDEEQVEFSPGLLEVPYQDDRLTPLAPTPHASQANKADAEDG